MGNIKKYTVDYDWKAELTVEIDHDIVTDDALREMNEFWSNHEWRESKHGLLNAVLIMLARHVMPIAYELGYNAHGIRALFDWDKGNGQEGWPPMDGTQGIKITSIDVDGVFDEDDFTVKAA
jgi:hypothetical protein